jgi:tRNA-specific 2-thiouridylase
MKLEPQRVVLAMSGGVDSSVSAQLLMEQGFEVIGVFMRHGGEASACAPGADTGHSLPIVDRRTSSRQGCCTAGDALDARRVAARLGIPFYALDLSDDFSKIINYFVDEYSAGRTPNPCVMCNHWVKFGRLFAYADSVGARYVATGHYARLVGDERHGWGLYRGRDAAKDQSYVLFGVERDRLKRMLLPVGEYQKQEIRQRAAALGLRVADKPDSQEICFVEAGRHADFVRQRRGGATTGGEIVTRDGRVVGHHEGIERFTIGQRKKLGVALGEPYFVVEIQPDERRVVIGRRNELACHGLTAGKLNWFVDRPRASFEALVQIRYNSSPHPARVRPLKGDRMHVEFAAPCEGVAPGQAVVCYRDDQVLGGGWIESAEPL